MSPERPLQDGIKGFFRRAFVGEPRAGIGSDKAPKISRRGAALLIAAGATGGALACVGGGLENGARVQITGLLPLGCDTIIKAPDGTCLGENANSVGGDGEIKIGTRGMISGGSECGKHRVTLEGDGRTCWIPWTNLKTVSEDR